MKYISRQVQRQKEKEQTSKVIAIILTCFCYVLHKRYRWTTKTLQSLVNEVGDMIIKADKNIDWSKGLQFWRDRMGLKI